jgi:cytochrome P450
LANVTSGYLAVRYEDIDLLGDYFRGLIEEKIERPRDDLISALIQEKIFDHQEDLVVNAMMVFGAGRVTTQKLLGNGVPLLLPAWTSWRAGLCDSETFLRRLTEELLRIITPTRSLVRFATRDMQLEDGFAAPCAIQRGQRLSLFLEAANRDSQIFDAPHCVKHDRQPNPHVAFGFGPHRCPGASVSRLEIQIALRALLETFATLGAHPSVPPSWDPNPNLGGFTSFTCVCS